MLRPDTHERFAGPMTLVARKNISWVCALQTKELLKLYESVLYVKSHYSFSLNSEGFRNASCSHRRPKLIRLCRLIWAFTCGICLKKTFSRKAITKIGFITGKYTCFPSWAFLIKLWVERQTAVVWNATTFSCGDMSLDSILFMLPFALSRKSSYLEFLGQWRFRSACSEW